jgi:exopolyphosphatase/pppGpp-phosphohydrolase
MTRKQLQREAKDLQAFVDELYRSNKPKNVVDEFIAERSREAAREKLEKARAAVVVLDASALLAFFSTWAGPGLRVSLQLIR